MYVAEKKHKPLTLQEILTAHHLATHSTKVTKGPQFSDKGSQPLASDQNEEVQRRLIQTSWSAVSVSTPRHCTIMLNAVFNRDDVTPF